MPIFHYTAIIYSRLPLATILLIKDHFSSPLFMALPTTPGGDAAFHNVDLSNNQSDDRVSISSYIMQG